MIVFRTFILLGFVFCFVSVESSNLNSKKEQKLPKAKNLHQSQNIKDYVEKSQARSYEHIDHSHPDPVKAPASYEQDLDQSYDYEVYGEAEKYKTPTAYEVLQPVRRVEDAKVDCQKNHMIVTFWFSTTFNGFIYPFGQFTNCILFSGQNSNQATLILHHGPCGQKRLTNANKADFTAIIEHRLMIQWERDFVCEDDSSVIVRCDRPDDFNKTISWDFKTLDLAATLERSTHPGPSMWMDIQRGEGPNAPSLDDKPVFIGDVLTIVFTLSDEVFWFGTNILSCVAVQGEETTENVYEVEKYSNPVRSYTGRMTVIENECSTKPKIFSHIFKERTTKDGKLTNIHYAHFKAFRFPTSQKVILQCDVKVCYKNCKELPPCSTGFHPRAAVSERSKRDTSKTDQTSLGQELETVSLFRTIEVFSAEDGALRQIPVRTVISEPLQLHRDRENCFSSQTFYGWISVFTILSLSLLVLLVWYCLRAKGLRGIQQETPSKKT